MIAATDTRDARTLWDGALGELQLKVTRPSYETWLKGTVGLASGDGLFVVGTPNAFVSEMLEHRMYSLISRVIEHVARAKLEVRFQVLASESGGRPAVGGAGQATAADPGEPSTPAAHDGAAAGPRRVPRRSSSLNPRYTFERFVVGKSNELAHAASVAVAERPGAVYNPLFLYSDVGLGKTHILHAVGHRLRATGRAVMLSTTEEFTNDFISAIRGGTTEDFRDRYRSVDALLLDDIQFLAGKEQTQEGFFHTFNALHMGNRQIVVTSDRPLGGLPLLEGRVRSRLAGGLVADIQAPDFETRVAILRAKAEACPCRFADGTFELLSERSPTSIRELEGNLTRVVAYAELTGDPITAELIERIVAAAPRSATHTPTDTEVLSAVAGHFGTSPETLNSRSRDRRTSRARQVAMYLLREDVHLATTAIGRILGGRDHTTVIHAHRRIARTLAADISLRHDLASIRNSLGLLVTQRPR